MVWWVKWILGRLLLLWVNINAIALSSVLWVKVSSAKVGVWIVWAPPPTSKKPFRLWLFPLDMLGPTASSSSECTCVILWMQTDRYDAGTFPLMAQQTHPWQLTFHDGLLGLTPMLPDYIKSVSSWRFQIDNPFFPRMLQDTYVTSTSNFLLPNVILTSRWHLIHSSSYLHPCLHSNFDNRFCWAFGLLCQESLLWFHWLWEESGRAILVLLCLVMVV